MASKSWLPYVWKSVKHLELEVGPDPADIEEVFQNLIRFGASPQRITGLSSLPKQEKSLVWQLTSLTNFQLGSTPAELVPSYRSLTNLRELNFGFVVRF
jgi:hypothetical protein